jgi:dihydrofolate synthase/folylpolyglutamate synthase
MLESIYRAAGLRVGLFTSPHLVSFRERFQVDRQLIAEKDVARLLAQLRPVLEQFPPEEHPTFFEVITVMALRYFVEQKCDLVIWETGLGGRLDATNIVTPLASVITNVDYDHQQWLGDKLADIAFEKAGIIKPGVPVFTAASRPEALEVIRRTAREKQAPLRAVSDSDLETGPLTSMELPLHGHHQKLNAALAIAVVEELSGLIPPGPHAVGQGLARVQWPGRLQTVPLPGGRKIVLDGAHNVPGAAALNLAFREEFPDKTPALVLGILSDKDCLGMCRELAPLAARISLVPVASERTSEPEELLAACRQANPSAELSICQTAAEALDFFEAEPLVLVAGSLYLVGETLDLLLPSALSQERSLNEWNARGPGSSAPEKKSSKPV